MSGYACPSCGEVSHPFGSGGVEETCAQLGVPFLGRVPLDIAIRTASAAGTPPAAGEGPQADAFMAIARQVSAALGCGATHEIGSASCRERVCQYVLILVVAVSLKKKSLI